MARRVLEVGAGRVEHIGARGGESVRDQLDRPQVGGERVVVDGDVAGARGRFRRQPAGRDAGEAVEDAVACADHGLPGQRIRDAHAGGHVGEIGIHDRVARQFGSIHRVHEAFLRHKASHAVGDFGPGRRDFIPHAEVERQPGGQTQVIIDVPRMFPAAMAEDRLDVEPRGVQQAKQHVREAASRAGRPRGVLRKLAVEREGSLGVGR